MRSEGEADVSKAYFILMLNGRNFVAGTQTKRVEIIVFGDHPEAIAGIITAKLREEIKKMMCRR